MTAHTLQHAAFCPEGATGCSHGWSGCLSTRGTRGSRRLNCARPGRGGGTIQTQSVSALVMTPREVLHG